MLTNVTLSRLAESEFEQTMRRRAPRHRVDVITYACRSSGSWLPSKMNMRTDLHKWAVKGVIQIKKDRYTLCHNSGA